jgi:Tol biopolymer transport system component
VVAVLAAVLLIIPRDDKKDNGTATAFGAFLPRSAAPLSADTMVWASQRNSKYDIFSGRVPDGSGTLTTEKKIISAPGNNLLPVLTPDRRTVIYFKPGTPNTLHAIAADGSGSPVQLFTSGPGSQVTIGRDARPSVDPTGDWLVVRGLRGPDSLDAGLWVIAMDGSNARRLKVKPGATDPAWSPNGEFIVYFSTEIGANGGNLVTIESKVGADPRPLPGTGGAHLDADPTWSPDATKIAFRRAPNKNFGRSFIMLADPDGSNQQPLTEGQPGPAQDPSFAPQGGSIVYTRPLDDGSEREVFLINPNRRDLPPRRLVENPGTDSTPRWAAG